MEATNRDWLYEKLSRFTHIWEALDQFYELSDEIIHNSEYFFKEDIKKIKKAKKAISNMEVTLSIEEKNTVNSIIKINTSKNGNVKRIKHSIK